ncbi:MAG: DUF4173 domain-containing protein [Flavobacteriales bacterium]|nr:DUF4173 domain-containing protein [Flavobacteriales bacterium]
MKLRNLSILIGTLLFSLLFYNQLVGINYFLFSVLISSFLIIEQGRRFRIPTMLVLIGTVVTGFFAFVYGSTFAAVACIICLLILPTFWVNNANFPLGNLLQSLYSFSVSHIMDFAQSVDSKKPRKKTNIGRMLIATGTLIVGLVFFLIYREVNPLFQSKTAFINFDFFSANWLLFTLFGFLLVYSFFRQKKITEFDRWLTELPASIDQDKTTIKRYEMIAFMGLFVWLNIMLTFINALDIQYLYLDEPLPKEITHKQFVHKGVNLLMLSIGLGIGLLLYFFRGGLNFVKHRSWVKLLGSLWLIQNFLMVISTCIRNNMYIDEALLTYKRIGVYFWLGFSVIGISLTLIKVLKAKTSWYIIKSLSWATFLVMVLASAIDWDNLISKFNISRMHQVENISSYDKNYLLSLSEVNIPDLIEVSNKKGFEVDSHYSYRYDRFQTNSEWLDYKTFEFLQKQVDYDWRSKSIRRDKTYERLMTLHDAGHIINMDLRSRYVHSVAPLYALKNLKSLRLSAINPWQLADINHLQSLESLTIRNAHLNNEYIDTLSGIEGLTYFNLIDNQIGNLRFLEGFPNLRSLNLSHNNIYSLESMPRQAELQALDLSYNPITNISGLKKCTNLEQLFLNHPKNSPEQIPHLPLLKEFSGINFYSPKVFFKGLLEKFPSLEKLDLSQNNLREIDLILPNNVMDLKLKHLRIDGGFINKIVGIEKMECLEYLSLENNYLTKATELSKLSKLKHLSLKGNDIKNMDFISNLKALEHLNIQGNDSILRFDFLNELKSLKTLNLRFTNIDSLEMVCELASLETLDIQNCGLRDLSSLGCLINLKELSLSTVIEDQLTSIEALTGLQVLKVSNTEGFVIKKLRKLSKEKAFVLVNE